MLSTQEISSQKRIYLSPPHMTSSDLELLVDAFQSNWIAPLGPHVDAFEQEFANYLDIEHAVALSSGTAALHLALQVVGVRPGDEVFASTLTFVATANAIRYCGATPVFIDSERASWNMDPTLLSIELRLAAEQGRLPTAVIVVDVFGQCANYAEIIDLCHRYEIPLIEDAAESLGATYQGRAAGTLADIGCFSFNGNKIITTSGGGMLVTRNADWASDVRHLATQARQPAPHYQHNRVGYNYRLSNLLAAVGRGQLKALEQRVAKRRANYSFYHECLNGLPGIEFMPELKNSLASRWLTCMLIDPGKFGCSAEGARHALERDNIEARPVWKPMHLQPVNTHCRIRGGQISEDLFQRGLCLPSGSNLSEQELNRVSRIIRNCARPSTLVHAA